jgi:hypothetical protein
MTKISLNLNEIRWTVILLAPPPHTLEVTDLPVYLPLPYAGSPRYTSLLALPYAGQSFSGILLAAAIVFISSTCIIVNCPYNNHTSMSFILIK